MIYSIIINNTNTNTAYKYENLISILGCLVNRRLYFPSIFPSIYLTFCLCIYHYYMYKDLCHYSVWQARARLNLQVGQVDFSMSQVSIHSTWNWWKQLSRRTSWLFLKLSKHIEHLLLEQQLLLLLVFAVVEFWATGLW